jgi:hypothetical protein
LSIGYDFIIIPIKAARVIPVEMKVIELEAFLAAENASYVDCLEE